MVDRLCLCLVSRVVAEDRRQAAADGPKPEQGRHAWQANRAIDRQLVAHKVTMPIDEEVDSKSQGRSKAGGDT